MSEDAGDMDIKFFESMLEFGENKIKIGANTKAKISEGNTEKLKDMHCYQFLERPIFFLKRDLKETFDFQKKRPAIICFFFSCPITFE